MQTKMIESTEKVAVGHRICPYVYDALKRYAADNGMSIQKSLEMIVTGFLEQERESYLQQSYKAFQAKEKKKKLSSKKKKS